MDTKYNYNINCQIARIDTGWKMFGILWNSTNIQKSAFFKTFLKFESKHGAHLQYVSIIVWNYDNAVVYTFGRYSMHMRSNIY